MSDSTREQEIPGNVTGDRGAIPHLSPTIFRQIVESHPGREIRITSGDTYGIDCRGSVYGSESKILSVDIRDVGPKRS